VKSSGATWTALVEAKVGNVDLTSEQLESYLEIARFDDRWWLAPQLSTQPPERGVMLTYVRISADEQAWSAAVPISEPTWRQAHDAFALPRVDRGADLYYSYPSLLDTGKGCFGLYRRAVWAPDRFGPEQQVTLPGEFCAYSASAHRLADGAVLVTFSHILATDDRGVAEAQNYAARLADDAPVPEY
jgi:hypothetical protein